MQVLQGYVLILTAYLSVARDNQNMTFQKDIPCRLLIGLLDPSDILTSVDFLISDNSKILMDKTL